MMGGAVDSDGYFPAEAKHKKLGRPGELVPSGKYPDTEELTLRDQNEFVREANKAKTKPGFRH